MAITSGNTIFKSSANNFALGVSSSERMRFRGSPSGMLFNTTSSIHSYDVEGSVYILSNASDLAIQLQNRNTSATAGRVYHWGMTVPAEYLIYGNANYGTYMGYTSTSWISSSDERLKTDLQPITNAASKVAGLRTVTGRFISDEPSITRCFLIAQDVQNVLPEAVHVPENPEEFLGLAYNETLPLITAAVKELNTEVTNSTNELTLLLEELEGMKQEINTLKGV